MERLQSGEGAMWDPPQPTAEETAWRHGKWQPTRTLIRAAIARAPLAIHKSDGPPVPGLTNPDGSEILSYHAGDTKGTEISRSKRLERWDSCGACAVMEYSKSTDRVRITCWHCHDRLCEPCQKRRVAEVQQIIKKGLHKKRGRLITLTLTHRDEPLAAMIQRLREGFAKLKKHKLWKANVEGGLCVLEIKKNPLGAYQNKKGQWRTGDGRWHAHLHIVAAGGFIPQPKLSDAWWECTKDSFIVDIRTVDEPDKAAFYISKYVSKPCTASLVDEPMKLDEFVQAIAGTRAYQPFGNWMKIDRTPPDDQPTDWRYVATVRDWFKAFERKEPWAVALKLRLTERHTNPKNADTS